MVRCEASLRICRFTICIPTNIEKLAKEVDARRPELEADPLKKSVRLSQTRLTANEVPFVRDRGPSQALYSLWKKLRKQRIMIEQVYDLIATRIITPNDRKYLLPDLSVVHDIWTPVPERFKDWIAIPRDNLYQSLHTSVIGDGGQTFEVQIRTEKCIDSRGGRRRALEV
jgi:GTP pyrophosphokinase